MQASAFQHSWLNLPAKTTTPQQQQPARWCPLRRQFLLSCASSQTGTRRAADAGGTCAMPESTPRAQAIRRRGSSARFAVVPPASDNDSCASPPSLPIRERLCELLASPIRRVGPTADPEGSLGRGRSVGTALARDSRPSPQPAGEDEIRHCRLRDLPRTFPRASRDVEPA